MPSKKMRPLVVIVIYPHISTISAQRIKDIKHALPQKNQAPFCHWGWKMSCLVGRLAGVNAGPQADICSFNPPSRQVPLSFLSFPW